MLSHQHLTLRHNVAHMARNVGPVNGAQRAYSMCVLHRTPADLADVDLQMQVRTLLATQARSPLSAY